MQLTVGEGSMAAVQAQQAIAVGEEAYEKASSLTFLGIAVIV